MNKTTQRAFTKKRIIYTVLLCAAALALNLLGSFICTQTGTPLYLDTVGTVSAAAIGGFIPGLITAFVFTFLKGISDTEALFYSIVSMLMAGCGAYFARHGFFRKIYKAVLTIPFFTVLATIPDSILTWYLYPESQTKFAAQLLSDFKTELTDKSITVLLVFVVVTLVPLKFADKFKDSVLYQAPLTNEMRKAIRKSRCRSVSINTKIALLLTVASFFIAGSSTIISFVLFRDNAIDDHISVATGVSEAAAEYIDPEMVDEYLEKGESAEGYMEAENVLRLILKSHENVEYLYVYKIESDGCHVVFDIDTEDMEGDPPGTVIEFDPSFREVIPTLLAGGSIDPIISNDKYGWLLTTYTPVYSSDGICQCYAAADISMDDITDYQNKFIAKLIALFIGFFTLIIAISMWFVRSNILLPVNTMAYSAGAFAFNSGEALEENVERLKKLDICTGDEIENLYLAFVKTTEDSMKYVEDIRTKTETISKMQNGLIMVLADMVESRDKCTGDHVRKTAAYAKIIMNEMKKRGFYDDQLTDEFINNVINAAPLHDIGKIHVSDVILNKPGRLTDDEFEIMKIHTTIGSKIISRAIDMVPDPGYLAEAKNLSEFHHEKWNGKGYPHGLSGEDIPLSARIMAVADVFDALVSRRSYKEPYPFDKALDIIKKDAGSHFDPLVAEAFIGAEEEVRKVAEDHRNYDKVDI